MLKDRNHSDDVGMGGKIILKWILGKCVGRVWTGIHMAQDRDLWWTLLNLVNLKAP
jgi:hypothetical protein